MPEVTSVEQLRKHIGGTKAVEVADADGSILAFEVRTVSILILVGDLRNSWSSEARAADPKAFGDKVAKSVANPTHEQMRQVLLKGVVRPRLSDGPSEDAVPVDDLLGRDILALNLYAAIAAFSTEHLLQVKVRDDAKPQPGG